jgi:preprotein translocase subunit YajC
VHTTGQSATNGSWEIIVGYAVLLGIFWLLFLRPMSQRQRKQREMLKTIKRGDKVVTQGGLHGVVVEVKEEEVLLRVAPKVDVTVDKSSIQRVFRLPKDEGSKEEERRPD